MNKQKKELHDGPSDLWDQELVKPISFSDYDKQVADTEKIILFGESSSGKTSFYLSIPQYLKDKGTDPNDFLMYVVFSDRPSGIKKLFGMLPSEYRDRINIIPINKYEDLVSATATAQRGLIEHFKKTGKHGWLVVELLEEAWKDAQDYYSRQAYGKNLGDYFAQKRAEVKAMQGDDTAYKSLSGWGDWTVIKYFHNFNWIDKIKRMPWNVVFTSELKAEGNKDSVFYDLGYRPAGEKDNMHRVDTILLLSHKENSFTMKPYKLTGYRRLYSKIDITDKGPYKRHQESLEELRRRGYKTSLIEEVETESGIVPPKKPVKKQEKQKVEDKGGKEEKKEDEGWEDI